MLSGCEVDHSDCQLLRGLCGSNRRPAERISHASIILAVRVCIMPPAFLFYFLTLIFFFCLE